MARKRGARTTRFISREAQQPARLALVLAGLEQLVIEQPKTQARAVGQPLRERSEPRPLDRDQLLLLFEGIARLAKQRGSDGLAKTARAAKARDVRELKALAAAMEKQHARLHRLLDITGRSCDVAGMGCRSEVPTIVEHARVIHQLKVRAGFEETLLATFLERVPRAGLVLTKIGSKERRRVDDLPSLLAALRDLAGLEPVDLGFLRAAIEVSFRLPIDEDAEAAALHTVHQALYVWDQPPRSRSATPAKALGTPDSK